MGIETNSLKERVKEYFSYDGRITRQAYILRVLGRWLLSFLAFIIIIILTMSFQFIYESISPASDAYAWVVMIEEGFTLSLLILFCIIYFYIAIVQEVKRLHDTNNSGWCALARFIPLINYIFFIYLIIQDGTTGPNKYGDDPKGRTLKSQQRSRISETQKTNLGPEEEEVNESKK